MIMSTDLLMPALDPVLPAEISPAIMTGVLREELGFDGVVVTDALYMQGISKKYSMATAAAMAIEAGNDMLEGAFSASSVGDMKQAILDAMRRGDITPQRIDESVRRILLLKMRMGILPVPAGVAQVTPLGSMTPTVVDGPLALAPRS
jgi:beta-N-acetylhexosaminidase